MMRVIKDAPQDRSLYLQLIQDCGADLAKPQARAPKFETIQGHEAQSIECTCRMPNDL